jgi:hypothetical protein
MKMVASTLRAGSVAIIGYNTGQTAEAPATLDKLHFVLMEPIGSGTQIFITDRAWTANATSGTFAAAGGGDATLTYTAASDLPAGTVVTVTLSGGNVTFTVNGTTTAPVSAGGFDIDHVSGDTIYMYQGAINAPTRFLFAAEIADGNTTFNASLVNTGLTVGTTAIAIAQDSGAYNGPTTHAESFLWNGAGSTLLHSIGDATNWVGDDATGDNAREQEVQTGPWFTHADVEFWGTMGGGGLANTLKDSSHASGNDDYNHTRQYDGVVNGVQVFWFARDMVFDTVDGKFFVVDSTNGENRILQGNISDLIANPTSVPNLTVLVSDTGTTLQDNYYAMEVDIVNNIVYFVHGSQVEKVNYNTANQTPTVLFRMNVDAAGSPSGVGNPAGSTNNFINDMVINFNTGKIYLSSTRVVSGASDQISKNFIYELSGLTTSSGTDAFTFNASNTGTARLLPFAQNDDAYNPGGSNANSPATAANQAYFLAQEYGSLDGLAIDPVSNILYFSTGEILFDHDLNSGTPVHYIGGIVGSYALSGNPTGVHTVLYQQTAQFGGAIPGLMGDLEIDTASGHLYVLDYAGINGVNDDNHWFRLNTAPSTPIQFTQTIGDVDGAATVGLTLNHAPTLTGNAAGGLAVTEASSAPNSGETARVTLFTGITIADVDTTTADEITGAVIRIGNGFTFEASALPGHAATVDFLRINNLTSGTIAGSGINFTYNSSTGAMVLTGAATVAEYKAAIELVQFSTSGDNVTNDGNSTTRTIHVSVSDGLTMSDEISVTVNVTGINDGPVNTVGAAMNFTEDTTGIAGNPTPPPAPVNAITGISIADADADSTTETFVVTLTVANGTLTVRTDVTGGLPAGNISNNGSSSVTLIGTQDQINATLAAVNNVAAPNGLVYTPNANFNGADTLLVVTNDQGNNGNDPGVSGTGTNEQDSDTKTLNVADVNDAPTVIDTSVDSPVILEDTPFTNLTAPSVATLFGGSFSDALDVQFHAVNNPTGSVGDTFAGIAVVANGSNANGNWQYWDGDSWENIGAATEDAAKTFTASTLIRFNPTLNFNGVAPTLTVRLIESGGPAIVNAATVDLNPSPPTSGPGSVYSTGIFGTVTLSQSITAVNDAPVNTVGGTTNAAEDGGAVNVTGISIADVDANPATDVVTVTLDVDHGILSVNTGVAGGVGGGGVSGNNSPTVTLTGTLNAINATLAAAGGLTYTPDSDYNGADRVRVTTNDGGATGQDPVPGTANGTSEQDEDDKAIAVAATNDPVGTVSPGAVNNVPEDSVDFAVTGMSITDVDATLAPNGVYEVTLSSTQGTMTLTTLTGLTFTVGDGTSDTTMTFHGTLSSINTALATAKYTPTAHYNGSAQIQLQATDTFGGVVATGTGAATNDSNTINVTVTAVNDPVTTAAPATASLNEDATDVAIVGLSIADADAALAPAGVYEVTLSATHGTIKLTTLTGLTFSAGDGTSDATMTFHGTLADINAALATASYTPDSHYNGPAEITLQATDTFGGIVATGSGAATNDSDTVAVTVTSVNDEPAGTDATLSMDEDGTHILTAANFGFSDPIEGNALAGVVLTTLPANGDLYLNNVAVTVAGTVISITDINNNLLTFKPDPNANGTGYASFTFQVRDDGGTLNGGQNTDQSPNTITFDVDAINDAPLHTVPGGQTINEDATLTFNAANLNAISVADVDAGSADLTTTVTVADGALSVGSVMAGLSVTGEGSSTLTLVGTLAEINDALEGLAYAPPAHAHGSRTITVTTNDGGATGDDPGLTGTGSSEQDSDQIGVTINSVNDEPSGADKTVATNQDTDYTFTTADFGFSDAIDLNSLSGVLITTTPTPNGALTLSGSPVSAGTTVSATDIIAGNLKFVPDAGETGSPHGSFTFQVVDNGGTANGGIDTDQTPNTMTVNVGVASTAPDLDLNGGDPGTSATLAFSEGNGITAIAPAATVTDVDSPDFGGGTLTVTLTQVHSGDFIFLLDGNGIVGTPGAPNTLSYNGVQIGTYTSTQTTYTFTFDADATPAAVEALTRQMGFGNQLDSVTSGDRTVTYALADGDGGSAQAVATVTVTAANDLPAILAFDPTVSGTEDTNLVFKAANSNAITIADPDDTSVTVTLTVLNGRLTLSQTTGLSVTGDGTASVELTGSPADINAALEGLIYRGNLNYEGSDTLTIEADDGDGTDTENVAITLADDGIIHGDSGNNPLTGTPQPDFFWVDQGGDDDLTGQASNDVFLFGNALTSADKVNGNGGLDQIAIQGNYVLTLGADILSVESLALLPGNDTRFGDTAGNHYDYDLTTVDANVAAGAVMFIDGGRLRVGEDLTFDGSAETDGGFFIYAGLGVDTLTGGDQTDVFLFGNLGQWGASDVIDGGDGIDQLALRGTYTITFGAGQLIGIENFGLLSAHDSLFGPPGGNYNYNLTMNDANVAAGVQMIVDAFKLRPTESLTFNGSAESNGSFKIFGGQGADTITGGQGADIIVGGLGPDAMTGGLGNDVFMYRTADDSISSGRDGIQDFAIGDILDLSRVDAIEGTPGNDAFTFIEDDPFNNVAGELRASIFAGSIWLVEGDTDGDGNADLEFFVTVSDADPITITDFLL